jgi:Gpi18-like mannosyltransferase
MYKWEKRIINFVQKHIIIFAMIFISLIALLLRYYLLPIESKDYIDFIIEWYNVLQDNGGILAIDTTMSNYTSPYMILLALLTYIPIKPLISVKALSIIFDFILAFVASRIVFNITHKNKFAIMTYIILLLLPTVFLNYAAWAQCDSIYVSFLLLCILYIIKERPLRAFIFFGIAFAFKLQAIFLLPALIIYYFISKKISIKYFFIIPAIWILSCIPPIIAGQSVENAMSVYLEQVKYYDMSLSFNYPNIPLFVEDYNNDLFVRVFFVFTIAILLVGLIYMIYKKTNVDNENFIVFCIWGAYV